MTPLLRKLSLFTAAVFCLAALASALMRPQGLPLMMEKYREMKTMEAEIRQLRQHFEEKKQYVERLRVSEEERRRAVRQHLNKALPGETVIILPEGQQAQPLPQEAAPAAARQAQ
jgi:hypothetical protein